MQIAYRARDITEAHIIAGMLGAHGIEAHVGGHYLQGAMGEIGAAGFSNVHVDDEDVYRARVLIDDYETGRPVPAAKSAGRNRSNHYARWAIGVGIVVLWLLWQF